MSLCEGAQCVICGGSFPVWDSDRYKFVYVTRANGATEEYAVCPRCQRSEAYGELCHWAEVEELREMLQREERMKKARFWSRVWRWMALAGLIFAGWLAGWVMNLF